MSRGMANCTRGDRSFGPLVRLPTRAGCYRGRARLENSPRVVFPPDRPQVVDGARVTHITIHRLVLSLPTGHRSYGRRRADRGAAGADERVLDAALPWSSGHSEAVENALNLRLRTVINRPPWV